MSKKIKKDKSTIEALKAYKSWNALLKDLEKQGMYGAEYYVNRVTELEEEVKKLKAKLKKEKLKHA